MDQEDQITQDYKPLIMVIDDNPDFLEGIKLPLEMEGYQVWTANSGKDAWEQLLAAFLGHTRVGDELVRAPAMARLPDLILADIMMPEMDGYEFYESVRANPYLNHIPFIFLTALSADEEIRRGKELGADDYITKLASSEDMIASVRGKLRRVQQQKSLFEQIAGGPLEGSRLLAVAAALLFLLLGFCLGSVAGTLFF